MSSDQTISLLVSVAVQTASLPLELTRVQGQVRYSNHSVPTPRSMPFGSEIAMKNGVSGLYVGASTMVVRSALYTLLRTNIYLPLFASAAATDKYNSVSVNQRALYSGVASGVAAFALTPLDLVLLRQQVDNTLAQPRGYAGLFDGLTKASSRSFKDLFIGANWNSAKWAIYASSMLALYDSFSEFWPRTQGEWFGNKPLAIACSSLFACAFSLPFDNIKTKLQHQTDRSYKNGADALIKSLNRAGFFDIYIGFWHYYARCTGTACATVILVDLLRNAVYD